MAFILHGLADPSVQNRAERNQKRDEQSLETPPKDAAKRLRNTQVLSRHFKHFPEPESQRACFWNCALENLLTGYHGAE